MNKDSKRKSYEKHTIKTAILVDGGFYRKRAKALYGYDHYVKTIENQWISSGIE